VSSKEVKWKGHEGTVLKVDWNPVSNLIVSGGEDCKYKVWDTYGRQLYSSKATEFPITSVRWCPSGDYFAVGSFNTMSLCDKTGWTHSRARTKSGSIISIDWTSVISLLLCAAYMTLDIT
jgi:intraflagellar transport protein 80